MAIEWWHWAVLGLLLVLSELVVPSFVLVWFGAGALVVAGLVWIAPGVSMVAQILVLVAVSLVFLVLWFRVFKPNVFKTRVGLADSNIVGEVGLLTHPVAPFANGQVRFQRPLLGAEVWECMSDESIAVGERVRVLGVEGNLVKIGKA